MSDDQRWADKIDNEILEWVLNNSDSIETITPRMLIKIIDIKQSKITISECVDEEDDEGPCSDFEPQGIIMLVILWVSLIALLLVLVTSTYSGLRSIALSRSFILDNENWAIILSEFIFSKMLPWKLSISSSVDLLYFQPKEIDIKYLLSVSEKLKPLFSSLLFIALPTLLSVTSKLDPISILSTKVIEIDPNDANSAYYHRGLARNDSKQYQEAIEDLTK